jgi:nicotinate-nucleotide pyrophosphorylase (carboxylating)
MRVEEKNADVANFCVVVRNSTRSLLVAERLVLNLMQRMSGIATATALYVRTMNSPHTRLLDTRKTAPGMRMLDKAAVRHGGGVNHRIGLYDMVLIKVSRDGDIRSGWACMLPQQCD